MPKVSVQIVTWNSARYIGDCLDALAEQDCPLAIIVVDNEDDAELRAILKEGEKIVVQTIGIEEVIVGDYLFCVIPENYVIGVVE